MFQDYYRDRAPEYLGKEFGPGFAQAVAKLAPGSWQGPIESGYGWHLVFVDPSIPGRVPAFEEVEPDVKTAWLAEQKAHALAEGVQGHAREVHGAPARAADDRAAGATPRLRRAQGTPDRARGAAS